MLYSTLIVAAAKAVGVPATLLLAICIQESNLTNAMVLHDGGSPSYGVCQIKYSTAKMLGYRGKAKGLLDVQTNATYSAKYLKYQLERYDHDWCKATAAYNAGTYNESKILPGKPRNLKYVKQIQKNLEDPLHNRLNCGKVKITEADVSYGN